VLTAKERSSLLSFVFGPRSVNRLFVRRRRFVSSVEPPLRNLKNFTGIQIRFDLKHEQQNCFIQTPEGAIVVVVVVVVVGEQVG